MQLKTKLNRVHIENCLKNIESISNEFTLHHWVAAVAASS